MSGIKMGPDGRLYWQIGDIGFNGQGPDGTKWAHPNSGVIARAMPQGDILGFAPPLCLTAAEADEVVQKTAEAVAEVLG